MIRDALKLHKALKDYIKFRADLDNDDVTDGQWCGQQGYEPDVIDQLRQACPNLSSQVLEATRARYAEQTLKVDKALLKKALAGNTTAQELWYRKHENWTPKQAEDAMKRNPTNKTFAELMMEVKHEGK